jgi:hypothetical protein
MRLPPRSLALVLGLGLSLACSSGERGTQPAEPEAPSEEPSFDELRPHVGDPAPAISLATLDGSRVSLPMSDADRAAILIFGSFS